MNLPETGCLLRIFIGESDRIDGKPLYEWLILEAKARGMAGATAWRAMMGYGANSRIHTSKILRLSADLPVIIEFVDVREKLEAFLDHIDPHLHGGLATIEDAQVRFYRGKHSA
jgi:PII-like signaling protein